MTKTEDMAVPEMVERVARAIHTQRNGTPKLWTIVTPEKRNEYRGYARAAIEAMRPELLASITYFDGYCQDEADNEDNCLAGTNQFRDAVAFADAVKVFRASLQTKGEKP